MSTEEVPGSPGKVRAMTLRAAMNEACFHPADARIGRRPGSRAIDTIVFHGKVAEVVQTLDPIVLPQLERGRDWGCLRQVVLQYDYTEVWWCGSEVSGLIIVVEDATATYLRLTCHTCEITDIAGHVPCRTAIDRAFGYWQIWRYIVPGKTTRIVLHQEDGFVDDEIACTRQFTPRPPDPVTVFFGG
jgi:hypothetical protein